MTIHTKRMFQRVGEPPKEKRGHYPRIRIAGATITINCSCGAKLQRGTGCNRSGMDYCISYGKTAYEKHIKEV